MGTKNNPGQFDCYENADPDEPMFVLLARDPLAVDLVLAWADKRAATRGRDAKVYEAIDCAKAMIAWSKNEAEAAEASMPNELLDEPVDYRLPQDEERLIGDLRAARGVDVPGETP